MVASIIPEDFPLGGDLCHREACRLAKEILKKQVDVGLGISLLQFDGHTMLVFTDLKSVGSTNSKVAVNVGIEPPPELKLIGTYFYYEKGVRNESLGNPDVEQMESVFLKTDGDVDNAYVETMADARNLPTYYPGDVK